MANIDVVSVYSESFELIRARWREVLTPLAALFGIFILLFIAFMALMVAQYVALLGSLGAMRSSSDFSSSLFTNAMSDTSSAFLALGSMFLLVVILFVLFIFLISVVSNSIIFYIMEHFYSIMQGVAITESWKARVSRHAIRTIIYFIFMFIIVGLLYFLPLMVLFFVNPLLGFVLLMLALLIELVLAFMIAPAWVYYFMDKLSIVDSVKKSIALVRSNPLSFFILYLIGTVLYVGLYLVTYVFVYFCCLLFPLLIIVMLFSILLFMVAMMKMKLQLEGKDKTVGFKAPQENASAQSPPQPAAQAAPSAGAPSQNAAEAPISTSFGPLYKPAAPAAQKTRPAPKPAAKKPSAKPRAKK